MSSCSTIAEKRRNFKDAGRVCPVDYRIASDAFSADPIASVDTLYVVGGLYGNTFALDALDARVASDQGTVQVVLNGDVHWFDRIASDFAAVEQRVGRYIPLVGNVELELRRENDVGVGCGCAYPDCTSDADVSRSNRIHATLSHMINDYPKLKESLVGRPATALVDVSGVKVAITHGDEQLIGGWGCSRESLQDVIRQDEISRWMKEQQVDVLATTHTCAPVALSLDAGIVINNGAAGMPNFKDQHFGLVTRISKTPSSDALYRAQVNEVYVETVPLRYDHDAFVKWFDGCWSRTSPAAISYRARIVDGADDYPADALLGGFEIVTQDTELVPVRDAKNPTSEDVDYELASLMYFEDMIDVSCLVTKDTIDTIQVNVGTLCNLSCAHCHVEAGPHRTEIMQKDCFEAILSVVDTRAIKTIDVTGGAPEMNPHFEWFIEQAAKRDVRIMVRSNLVILLSPRYRHLFDRYAELGVEVVASLPNVQASAAEQQRGDSTFASTIEALKTLNEKGYGRNPELVLDLVFNPQWPLLPPEQQDLEELYHRRLKEDYEIDFDNLFAISNNPIGRYGTYLLQNDELGEYMELLLDSFNEEAAYEMMCRTQISVGYDGRIYDCDFNQVVGLTQTKNGEDLTIFDYAADKDLPLKRKICFGNHCYACTAGQGSSCTGTLVQ